MDFIDLKSQQNQIRDKIENRIQSVLDHGKYIMGPEVSELEEKLAAYVNVKYCITCSSGTDALLLLLMAKDIGPGDAVLTTPFTYIATAEVISLLGAEPIFVDIYPETFNMDPSGIQDAIQYAFKKGLMPKAIIPVDLFGLPARYRLITEIAQENNLFILEDAAQGFGGSIRSKKSGSFGHAGATSFFPAKPFGCYGDGGAVFTNDEELASVIRSIRVHGSGSDKYDNIRVGINGRLDTIQAAILLEKFEIFEKELELRNNVASYYNENLNSNFRTPYTPKDYFSSWAQYSLLADSDLARQKAISSLRDCGIPSMIYYRIPLHLQKVFQNLGYNKGDFPISEKVSDYIFSLPMHPYISTDQQNQILEVLNHVL